MSESSSWGVQLAKLSCKMWIVEKHYPESELNDTCRLGRQGLPEVQASRTLEMQIAAMQGIS